MADLFVSYARADSREFVARLSAALADRGKDAWVDLDDIPPASSWNDDLRAGIAGSDAFCFVISPGSVASPHCRSELEHAVALGKRILPVLHLPVAEVAVPEAVGSRNWIPQTGRFVDVFESALDALVVAIETDLDWVREHTRWGLRAEEWERRDEDRSLLARGSDLDQAEAFVGGGAGHEPPPTELQGRYALASRHAASRRQRQLVTGVSVALVVSLVLGVLAFLQRNTAVEQRREADEQRREAVAQRREAEKQRADATSRALAANAFLNLPTDPELSVLLALQAVAASPTREAEEALRSSILDSRVRGQLAHGDAVGSASYSPDGSRIVSTSLDGTAVLWDSSSGEKVTELSGHKGDPQSAKWSADGSRVVTIAQDGTARVFDGRSGHPISVITEPDEPRLTDMAISADGSVVVTAAFVSGQVHLWDATNGSLLGTIPRSTVDRVALSPDNTLVLLAMQNVGAELWSTADLTLVASYPEDAQGFFDAAAFSPDGGLFVTAGDDGRARVRDLAGTVVADVQDDAAVEAAAFSPDSARLATASEDGTAQVTDLSDGQRVATYTGHVGPVETVAFSASGNLVATGGRDGKVQLWRPTSGAQVATLAGHRAPVNAVAFSPVGEAILSASDDSTVRIWSSSPSGGSFPEIASTPLSGYEGTFSADARYAVVSDLDDAGTYHVQAIDVDTGEVRGEFELADDDFGVRAISSDGGLVMSTGTTTRVRSSADGSVVSELPTPGLHAAFDGAGQRLLLVGYEEAAAIYELPGGQLDVSLQDLAGASEHSAAAFSPDERTAAAANVDGQVRVWDTATGEQILSFTAFDAPGRMYQSKATVAFSPDGRLLATAASYENDANLWDAASGEHIATLEGVPSGVTDLAYSPSGRYVATATFGGLVRLWDGHDGRLLATVVDSSEFTSAVRFSADERAIALITSSGGSGLVEKLSCEVCVALDSLVELGLTRVTRELTATEKASYLAED